MRPHNIICTQRHGKNVTAATNAQAIIEELLDAYILYGPCSKESSSSQELLFT
jgi:hypothetical protein